MKKIKSLFFGVCVCILFSCKKEIKINGTRDLKNLSLSQLKNFLNGHWRLHRAEIGTIAGVNNIIIPDSVRVYLIFFSADSIRRENTINNIVIREKLIYERLQLPLGANSTYAYVLMFDRDIYDYRNKWVADRLVNDTLIFENYFKSEGGDRYYYTKEP